jgi:hypothetical protein
MTERLVKNKTIFFSGKKKGIKKTDEIFIGF